MKKIPLTQGYVALVDDEDYKRVSQFNWSAHLSTKNGVVVRAYARSQDPDTKRLRLLHRFILGLTNPAVKVDHKDRNGLNCQKKNLRIDIKGQNAQNVGLRSDNVSGYKGVFERKGVWAAVISFKGSKGRKHLGYFATAEDAARAYDNVARKYHGEFAFLNFPNEKKEVRSLRNTVTGLKGVSWHERLGKWQATARVNGKSKYLGLFLDPVEAARAYDAVVKEYRGDLALTNVMLGLLKEKP